MGLTGNWDGRISRRTLLRAGGSATAAYVLLGRQALAASDLPPLAGDPFSLGVASGDPTPGGVVLWTRLAPTPLAVDGGMPATPVGVRYEIALDERFRRVVRRGAIQATPDEAHTIHAEIHGLWPDTTYWYRFKAGPHMSRAGRTRTAPWPFARRPVKFAYVSCQNYSNGFYHAFGDLAQQDVELVVHLGDYIYEGPGTGVAAVRNHSSRAEIFTLSDYRVRHAQYKTDAQLQAAHAAFPWLMTWDDHEFKDNYADLDLDPDPVDPHPSIAERRANAYLAYWEHSPLPRARKPVGKDMPLYRRAQWGSLLTFHVLDTRQYRSDQPLANCVPGETGYCPEALDPARGILGAAQRDWLFDGLTRSRTRWDVLANQVGFAPVDINADATLRRFARDKWDGYVAERQALLDLVAARRPGNVVVITGDAHENSVRDVPPDFVNFDAPPVATEFVGTSISSEGDTPHATSYGAGPQNPHIHFTDRHRGYVNVALAPDVWRNEFRVVDSVRAPEPSPGHTLATFAVADGQPGAVLV